jgi:hypothetical protein
MTAASTHVEIGGIAITLEGSAEVCAAAAARYRSFLTPPPGSRAVRLRIDAAACFDPAYERPAPITLSAVSPTEVRLAGALEGRFDLGRREGFVEQATGLGAIDGLVRAALSLVLPLESALLLHGALVPTTDEGALILCGASGAGKSTAAARLGACCDELTVVRQVAGGGFAAWSTPYWGGLPFAAPCRRIVALERGLPDVQMAPDSTAGLRWLAPHVVRYACLPLVERAILTTLAAIARSTPIQRARCPEGDAFVPFLRAGLGAALEGRP